VARRLHAAGAVKEVRSYAYDEIMTALQDVEEGTIGAFMKLEPVMRWLTASRPALRVVQTAITSEMIAIAAPLGDERRVAAVNEAQQRLRARGRVAEIGARWLRDSDPRATGMVT
jgi:ABC-type amino acid transport substrate-binding protein